MKKNLKLFLISLIMLTVVTGCSLTKLSREKFKSIMESEKYEVVDASNVTSSYGYIKSYDAARNTEHNIKVDFYIFNGLKDAINYFKETKQNMKIEEKHVSSDSNAINWVNYSSYITRTNSTYKRVIRKYNTILIIEAPAEKTANAMNIAKKLGY